MSPLTIVLVFSVAFGAAVTSTCPRECPTYWTSYGDYCYRFYGSLQTWHHAEGRCQRSYSGRTPHLVSIHSYGENAFLKHVLDTANKSNERFRYWIGLNELHWSNYYRWSDYSGNSYQNWQPGEPNNYKGTPEHCVEMLSDGWNDSPCNEKKSYICKMPK